MDKNVVKPGEKEHLAQVDESTAVAFYERKTLWLSVSGNKSGPCYKIRLEKAMPMVEP